ncbi:MAG: HlyD family efflux transporter periplasmic adaptor subunit [Blautia sp.]|nr:HlyD family efflux transporter periplasmic adaptor subunit [Blautia sp.]
MRNTGQKVKVYIEKRRAAGQEKMRREFLPEAQEIVEKAPSPIGHFVILTVALVVIFFTLWSVIGTMDEVVTARGKVVTVSGVQSIQSRDAGLVEEICVKEGEHVSAGQPIVLLDTSISSLTMQNTEESLALLKLENELLSAVLEGEDISGRLSGEEDADRIQMINYVLAIQTEYQSRRKELDSAVSQAQSQIELEEEALEKMKENIAFLETEREALAELLNYSNAEEWNAEKIQLSIAYKEEELESYRKLYELGALSKAEVAQAELELEQLKRDYEKQKGLVVYEDSDNSLRMIEIDNQLLAGQRDCNSQEMVIVLAEQKYRQALGSLGTLEAEFREKIAGLLVENENRISAQEGDYEKQQIYAEQQKIVAPVDGIIRTLDVNTKGAALTMAQPVAELLPDGGQMIVEVTVLNQDIGCIQVGQPVALKLDAYNFQEYGKLEGTIVSISPDALPDEQRGWVYQAKVEIDDEAFREKNPDAEIGTGLECTAEVKIGERRIIDFFLEPIVEHFDGSLKVQ